MLGFDTMSGMVQEKAMPARIPVPIAEAPIIPATEANSASTDLKKTNQSKNKIIKISFE